MLNALIDQAFYSIPCLYPLFLDQWNSSFNNRIMSAESGEFKMTSLQPNFFTMSSHLFRFYPYRGSLGFWKLEACFDGYGTFEFVLSDQPSLFLISQINN